MLCQACAFWQPLDPMMLEVKEMLEKVFPSLLS